MGHQGRCICDWMEDNIFGVFSGNYSPLRDLNRENSRSTLVKVSLLVESIGGAVSQFFMFRTLLWNICGYPPSKCQCLRKHLITTYVEWNSIWWRCEGLLHPSLTWLFPLFLPGLSPLPPTSLSGARKVYLFGATGASCIKRLLRQFRRLGWFRGACTENHLDIASSTMLSWYARYCQTILVLVKLERWS